ncbi:Zinc finger CCCH domain-containing protein 49 [Hibiscus syriacus]|uniref:Zinc finger CCCH domain-containing protein 49 n=1 Tax=Hibiscus syriacus TaxID=106335 RepID=A0A6A2YI94_HIBSY|nr:zinc finger CCCH domain-containing protein 2-like [Hibiscus syriacus]KAE8677919.1 Zinc finger CCCH domain-containing protein 49 [Hibiscus syriacus]
MSTACAEQQHKFMASHKVLPLREIEIPPRKLLFSHNHVQENAAMQLSPYEAILEKYLLSNRNYNGEDEENDADPYAADHFRMYEFKVRKCTRNRSHDWTDCPFAHPGEMARRRDPRRYRYSSTVCSDFRRGGGCPRGDDCDFAHGVFECWLHPTRYRTEACKDGKDCKRKVCFFAHSSRELRLLPAEASPKYKNSGSCSCSPLSRNTHCCLFCHSATSSPTSTLLGLSHLSRSPSSSPPLSPVKNGFSPFLRYSDQPSKLGTKTMSYRHVLNELMSSMEKMNFYEASSPMTGRNNNPTITNIPWLDLPLIGEDQSPIQFALSPSWPSPSASGQHFGATSKPFGGDDEKRNENGLGCDSDPDLGWVNELLI